MKHATTLAAAALAVASINLTFARAADTPATAPSPMHTAVNPANQPAQAIASASPDSEIQNVIANAAESALTPNHMAQLVSLLPDAQQQSLAKSPSYSENYGAPLNAQINAISKTWKQKYGNDFDIAKSQTVLSRPYTQIQTQSAGSNAKMETATVAIEGNSGNVEIRVPLVRQSNNDWRINAPGSLTAQKLRDNLVAQLTFVNNQAAHWPTKEADAYRMIARHELAAILDQPLPARAQASATTQPAAKMAQQSQTASAKPVSNTSSSRWYQFWKW